MLDCSSGLIKGIRFVFTVGIVWRARITSILSVIWFFQERLEGNYEKRLFKMPEVDCWGSIEQICWLWLEELQGKG